MLIFVSPQWIAVFFARIVMPRSRPDHDDIDYARIAAAVPVIFDSRGAYRARGIEASNVHAM